MSFHAKAGHPDTAALYARKLQDLTGVIAESPAMIELRRMGGVSSWRRWSPPRSRAQDPAVPKKPWNELSSSGIDLQLHITAMRTARLRSGHREPRQAGPARRRALSAR